MIYAAVQFSENLQSVRSRPRLPRELNLYVCVHIYVATETVWYRFAGKNLTSDRSYSTIPSCPRESNIKASIENLSLVTQITILK